MGFATPPAILETATFAAGFRLERIPHRPLGSAKNLLAAWFGSVLARPMRSIERFVQNMGLLDRRNKFVGTGRPLWVMVTNAAALHVLDHCDGHNGFLEVDA